MIFLSSCNSENHDDEYDNDVDNEDYGDDFVEADPIDLALVEPLSRGNHWINLFQGEYDYGDDDDHHHQIMIIVMIIVLMLMVRDLIKAQLG